MIMLFLSFLSEESSLFVQVINVEDEHMNQCFGISHKRESGKEDRPWLQSHSCLITDTDDRRPLQVVCTCTVPGSPGADLEQFTGNRTARF